eukprot:Sdes_comp19900_c0_seq6m12286
MCLLREMFGSGVEKIKIDRKVFTTPSKAKIEITTLSSNYHIEMSPSEAGFHDRIVVQEILKEIAQTQQLGNSPKPFKGKKHRVFLFFSPSNRIFPRSCHLERC